MNKRDYIRHRSPVWKRFNELITRLDRSTRKMTADDVRETSRLFREVCYDLSIVRSRDWGRGLDEYLNQLATRGHNVFYRRPPGHLWRIVSFLMFGFPQVLRKNAGYFLASCLLFFGPLIISWAVVQYDVSLASRMIDSRQLKMMEEMYSNGEPGSDKAEECGTTDAEPESQSEDSQPEESASEKSAGKPDGKTASKKSPEEKTASKKTLAEKADESSSSDSDEGQFGEQRAAMAGFYVQHNVGIALACFGRGVLLGIGTVYTLIFNGIALGAVSGFLIGQGHGERFLSFVVGHGSFELTAIAVAGAGGLMLGDALIHPGQRTRLESLRARGSEAIQVAFGAAAMLVMAALIEAFWSPAPMDPEIKYVVGGLLWLLVALYLAVAGRSVPQA